MIHRPGCWYGNLADRSRRAPQLACMRLRLHAFLADSHIVARQQRAEQDMDRILSFGLSFHISVPLIGLSLHVGWDVRLPPPS
jgi:hypothetical protein